MEEELRARLLASGPVTAICSDRVNWGAHPQGQPLPALVLAIVSDARGLTYSGPDGLHQARVQIDAYAPGYMAAKSLARAVRAALEGYRGGGFRGVFLDTVRDGREGGTNEADRPFRISMDFQTHWRDNE